MIHEHRHRHYARDAFGAFRRTRAHRRASERHPGLPAHAPDVGGRPGEHAPSGRAFELCRKFPRHRYVRRARAPQVARRCGQQSQQRGQHSRPVPQQGGVIGRQTDPVSAQLSPEIFRFRIVVMAHQRGGLVGDAITGEQHQREGERVLRSAGRRARSHSDVKAADARQRLPPEGHVAASAERRQREQGALLVVPGEDSRRETAALAVPAGELEPLLNLGVQPGRQDHARNTADVIAAGEPARDPGQPMAVGFLIVVEEGDNVAGCGGYPGVAGPGKATPSFHDIAVLRSTLPSLNQIPDGIAGRSVVHYDDLEAGILLPVEVAQARLQPVRPVAGAYDDTDERGRGQHVTAAAQERPRGRIGRQSPAGQRAGLGQAGRGEPVSHRFTQFRPEQRGELSGSQPGRIQPDDARADRLAVQPPEHPRAVVLPVVAHGGQRFGKLYLHHQGRGEPVTHVRHGPVVGRRWPRRAHVTSSRLSAVNITGFFSTRSRNRA